MKTFFQSAFALLLLVSCNKEVDTTSEALNTKLFQDSVISTSVYEAAENRVAGNMVISLTNTDKSSVYVTAAKVSITYLSGDSFIVVTNQGSFSQQTFTATSATITEPDATLKLTKNPGVNQIIYNDKSTCNITASAGSQLIVNIQPGNINTNALCIIGDEEDGL